MQNPLPIAIIGAGKIARDQHVPAIAGSSVFKLAAIVDPSSVDLGVPVFETLGVMLSDGPQVNAVAICTPPQVRTTIAREAISAGLHVLLEKPPAATLSEVAALEAAALSGCTCYGAWHSRHAPMVADAKAWLSERTIRGGRLVWREDAHRWHPGQHWLWQPGGLGVFDPAINAFSILTEITDEPWRVAAANFQVPVGLDAPISAQLDLRVGDAAVSADLHFNDDDTPEWTIEFETDGGTLALRDGGAVLIVDGETRGEARRDEYALVYRHFSALIAAGHSEVDGRPLRLVADAFLMARTSAAAPFEP